MKKTILGVLMTGALAGGALAAVPEDSRIFTPYFNMTLLEAGYVPSQGNIFSGGNVDTQVGMLTKLSQKDQLFGLYDFNYDGQGFAPQDTKQFTDRSMTHSFNFEYRRALSEKFRLRPGVSFSHDYSRTGADETWKNGLYNMNSFGLQLAGDYLFDFQRNGIVTLTVLTKNVKFPNYTDLLSEFNSVNGEQAGVNGGLEDQRLTQVALTPMWGDFFGGATYTQQDYKNQKVVDLNAIDSAGYGGTKQKDKTFMLDAGFRRKLWVLELSPIVSYTVHRSNQNYVRFKSLGAAATDLLDGFSDVTFVARNYDYNETTLSVPADLDITGKWAIGGALSVTSRHYTSRPRRDALNDYIAGTKQDNLMTTLTGSIRKRINEIATVRLFYSLVVASSNCKFEQYMPYNYTGNSFGVAYQLSY